MVHNADERSYPTSKLRAEAGRTPRLRSEAAGQEELPHVWGQGQWLRVPGCDSPGAAERSYPTPQARGGGQEEQPHVQGVVAVWAQEDLEKLFHIQSQRGSSEEIRLIQGKEQRLRFARAAMKRYPTSKVRETQVRR